MIKSFLLIFLLIDIINSKSFDSSVCNDVCDLNEYFNQSNGYGCFIALSNQIICTCPDKLHSINKRCRICDRQNICGSSNAFCSEESNVFISPNKTSTYACFCSSGLIQYNKKCPEEMTTNSIEFTTTTEANSITEITTNPDPAISFIMDSTFTTKKEELTSIETITTTSSNPCQCKSSTGSQHFIQTSFIISLNIVYFFNK